LICWFNFLIFLSVCLNISTVINIKNLTNSNQQTLSYEFSSHIAAFLSVVLITEMLEICIQTSYDQNVQLTLKSYLPVVYGTPLMIKIKKQRKQGRVFRVKNHDFTPKNHIFSNFRGPPLGNPIDTSIVVPVRGVA
jgi:hypothetical protein